MRKIISTISAPVLAIALWTLPAQAQVANHTGAIDLTTVVDSNLTSCIVIDAYHGTGDPPDVGMVLVHNNCEGNIAFAIGPWPLDGASDPKQFHTGGMIWSSGFPGGGNYKAGMVLAVCDASQTEMPQISEDPSPEEAAYFTATIHSAVQPCVQNANDWHDRQGH